MSDSEERGPGQQPAASLVAHRRELQSRKSAAYEVFEHVEAARDLPVEAWQGELAALVDRYAALELPFRPPQRDALLAVLRLAPDEARGCLAAWATLLGSAALGTRDRSRVALHFGDWLIAAGPGRGWLVRVTESIAAGKVRTPLPDLSTLASFAGSASANELAQFVRCADAYAGTPPDVVEALPAIVKRAVASARLDILDRLTTSISAEALREDSDGPPLFTALATLSRDGEIADDAWANGVGIILTLASAQIASGFVAARALPAALRAVDPPSRGAYLDDLDVLARTLGIRAVGFALRTLPRLYRKRGVDATRRYVAAAAEAFRHYGVTAAQEVLDLRTEAARKILSRGQ